MSLQNNFPVHFIGIHSKQITCTCVVGKRNCHFVFNCLKSNFKNIFKYSFFLCFAVDVAYFLINVVWKLSFQRTVWYWVYESCPLNGKSEGFIFRGPFSLEYFFLPVWHRCLCWYLTCYKHGRVFSSVKLLSV